MVGAPGRCIYSVCNSSARGHTRSGSEAGVCKLKWSCS